MTSDTMRHEAAPRGRGGLASDAFDRLASALLDVLDDVGVDPDVVDEVAARLAPLRGELVSTPSSRLARPRHEAVSPC